MEVPWAKWRADPNGYYARLGLNPARAVLMWEIDSAWRKRLRELHPDTGSGDVLTLARARVAYEVLSDPETRRQYDALSRSEVWMDELLLEEVVKVVTAGPEPSESAVRAFQQKQGEAGVGGGGDAQEQPVVAQPRLVEAPQVYFWEGDEDAVPDDTRTWAWATAIGKAIWELFGVAVPVKVGFTSGEPTVETRSWGVVYMVPAGVEPDDGIARAAALAGEKEARSGLRSTTGAVQ